MKQNQSDQRKVMVIGHRNPDTDSICSAIAYANLKNQTSTGPLYVPCRAGEPNQETTYVLNRFGIEPPRRCLDVSPQVQDIDVRMVDSVDGETTMRHAWEIMRDIDASTLSVTDKEGHLTCHEAQHRSRKYPYIVFPFYFFLGKKKRQQPEQSTCDQ